MRILISGATKGLGEALVREAVKRYPEAYILGFSRGQENVEASKKQLSELIPEAMERVHLIQGDISSEQGVTKVFQQAREILGGVDVLVNNVGIFDFDKNLSPIPSEDWELAEEDFQSKYAGDADYDKKQKYRRMVQANYLGNRNLLEAVAAEAKAQNRELKVIEVGSIGVVAELAGKPFEGTSHYGHTKGRLARHTMELAKQHEFIKVAVVHPGPFGRSAQLIADEYGDTWAIEPEDVAKHTFDLFDQLSEAKFAQGIIAAEKHFAIDSNYFGDIDSLNLDGLTSGRSLHVPERHSKNLKRAIL